MNNDGAGPLKLSASRPPAHKTLPRMLPLTHLDGLTRTGGRGSAGGPCPGWRRARIFMSQISNLKSKSD